MTWWKKKKGASTSVEILQSLAEEGAEVCELRPGLSYEVIAESGAELDCELPQDLRQVLSFTNGADLFGRASVIFGRHHGSPPYSFGDLVKATREFRRTAHLDVSQIVFGQRDTGQLFVLDCVPGQREVRYYVLDIEEREKSQERSSLANWLLEEISFNRSFLSV